MTKAHGEISWNELMTRDLGAAKAFYGKVCGWSFNDMPMPGGDGGTYTIAMIGDQMIGGLYDVSGSDEMKGESPRWLMYVEVDNCDEAAANTAGAGGTVHRPPFDIPGIGRIAMVADASGAVVGLMQSAQQEGA